MTTLGARLVAGTVTRSFLGKTILGGSSLLFIGLMAGNGVAYLYQMLMARMMTPADYGTLVTLTSITYVLAVVMRTFQAWVIKAVSSVQGSTAPWVRWVYGLTLRTLLPLATLALGVHWLTSDWVAAFLHLDSAVPAFILGFYTFSSLLIPIPRGILLGLDRLGMSAAISVLEPLGRLLAGVLLVYWGVGVSGALAAYAIGNLIAFAAGTGILTGQLRASQQVPVTGSRLGMLDRYALLVLITNTSLMVIASVDQVAVKHYLSAEVAGNYAVAFMLGKIISMTAVSLGWVIFARSATIPPDSPARARLLAKGLLIAGTIAFVLTAGYIAVPVLATQFLGGHQYAFADSYVGLVGVEMTLFALVYVQAYYLISVRLMRVAWPVVAAVLLSVFVLLNWHGSVEQILFGLIGVLTLLLIAVSVVSAWAMRTHYREARVRVVVEGYAVTRERERVMPAEERQAEAQDTEEVMAMEQSVPLVVRNLAERGRSFYRVAKRIIDLGLSLFALLVALPFILVIALAIKLDSPGPVFFKQTRIGKEGRPFTFYKFRSMYHNSDSALHREYVCSLIRNEVSQAGVRYGSTSHFKLSRDPRVTRVGQFLRRTSLDELPQLINVLKGEMSIVGPRPPVPYEVAEYSEKHMGRLAVVPGLTGWWQVRGRSRVPFEEMVEMDLEYIAKQSLWLDLKIMFLTIPAVLSGKGAE